jgi:hypothetical protein
MLHIIQYTSLVTIHKFISRRKFISFYQINVKSLVIKLKLFIHITQKMFILLIYFNVKLIELYYFQSTISNAALLIL